MALKKSNMSEAAINKLINQCVSDALAEHEANRNSGNGNDNGSHDSGSYDRRTTHTTRVCTYSEFLKCQPLNFKGIKGAVGLTQWFEKMEFVFHISNCTKTLMKMMTENYCPMSEIKMLETELWNLVMKGTDVESYTQCFQELILLCSRMVPEESDRVEKYIGGLPDSIQGSAYAARPGEKIEYAGTLPLCNKCKFHHNGLCTAKCMNCKRVGHLARDYRSHAVVNTQRALRANQNHGNAAGNGEARTRAYAVGGGKPNPDSNVVTGTFLLNNRYASILFDTGAVRN
ncbi:putative reverse transcriptase domain-containing protein [Tanacetum coccineum]